MDQTFTVSEATAWKLADLLRHELRSSRHESVLHLRLDDAERDELVDLAHALDN